MLYIKLFYENPCNQVLSHASDKGLYGCGLTMRRSAPLSVGKSLVESASSCRRMGGITGVRLGRDELQLVAYNGVTVEVSFC